MAPVKTSKNGAKRRRLSVQSDGRKRPFKKVWLPNETWTETFRFLNRSDLLRCVQPSCRRFHAICEWNVPNVHVIRRFDRFFALLAQNSQRAKTHVAHLGGSDASLAKHFQLTGTAEIHANIPNKMLVLRHSAELFYGCQIQMRLFSKFYRKDPAFLARRLAVIKSIRPCSIEILTNFLESDQLLREPLVMNCPRISLHEELCLLPRVATICRWLHHLPRGQKSSNKTTRLLNLNWRKMMMRHKLYELIDRCKEMLSQSKKPTDRRSFMLIFRWWEEVSRPGQRLALGQLKNELTGEVLRLEGKWIKIGGCYHFHYLLRRCLQAELDTIGRHFLRDLLQDTFGTPQSPHETDKGAHFVHFRAQTKEEGKCQMTVPRLKVANLHGEEIQ